MGLFPFQALPGVNRDDTALVASQYAVSADGWRVKNGVFETTYGCQDAAPGQTLPLPARGGLEWADLSGQVYAAAGSASKVTLFMNNVLYDITPIVATGTLTDEITTTNHLSVVSIAHTAHKLSSGQVVYLHSTTAIGGIQIGRTAALAADQLYTGSGSTYVTVHDPAHGMASGGFIKLVGGTAVNGITPAGTYSIHVIDVDNWAFYSSTAATGSGYGGGTPTADYFATLTATVIDANTYTVDTGIVATSSAGPGGGVMIYCYELPPGLLDGIGAAGYGRGPFGSGPWSVDPDPVNKAQFRPSTWTFDQWGDILVGNRMGSGVYYWGLNPSVRMTVVTNSPRICDSIAVTNERLLMAFGCCDTSDVYDPNLIRYTGDAYDFTTWTPTTANLAGSFNVTGCSEILRGIRGKNGVGVFTNKSLFFGTFTSQVDNPYQFLLQGSGCGLAAPNAVVEHDGIFWWYTAEHEFKTYGGATVETVVCPIQRYIKERIDTTNLPKMFGWYDGAYDEVVWTYASNVEIDSLARLGINERSAPLNGWTDGTTTMSTRVGKGNLPHPMGFLTDGTCVWDDIGETWNGAVMPKTIRFGQRYVTSDADGVAKRNMILSHFVADSISTSGYWLTLYRQYRPKGTVKVKGPYAIGAGQTEKSLKLSCRLIALEIVTNGWMRLGAMSFQTAAGPKR